MCVHPELQGIKPYKWSALHLNEKVSPTQSTSVLLTHSHSSDSVQAFQKISLTLLPHKEQKQR